MSKRLIHIGTSAAIAGLFLTALNPVNSTKLKLAWLACLVGLWAGLTILSWRQKRLRIIFLTIPLLAGNPFLLPASPINRDELRAEYLRQLSSFEGTKYFWGGETKRGIDCSGLPRRALRNALLSYGFQNLNGTAFRSFLEHWWFDASAKALSQGYRDYTTPLTTTGTIREMSYDNLIPGDLAVTQDGIHILAYLGDGLWIQADPGIGAVATLPGRTEDNNWFDTPVTTHRWQLLEKNDQ
jgi:hypothetical protein